MTKYWLTLLFIIGLFVLSGCASVQPSPTGQVCQNANAELCPDLLGGLEVSYKRDASIYIKHGAYAYASVHADGRCVIRYISDRALRRHRIHELNHCRGWNHRGLGGLQDSTWVPWPEALNTVRGGE